MTGVGKMAAKSDVEPKITFDAPSPDSVPLFDETLRTERRLIEIRTVNLDRITGIRTFT